LRYSAKPSATQSGMRSPTEMRRAFIVPDDGSSGSKR
jgi:hypothetical protein